MDAVPSGSYVAILHGASDVGSDDMPEAERRYNAQASAQFHARDREHVSRFFDGLDPVGPGLVNLSHWWEGTSAAAYSPDGRLLAVAGGTFGKTFIWSIPQVTGS
jgi:hypothetical protein